MIRTVRAGAALALALAARAWAADIVLSPPGSDGWRPLEFPKITQHTTYTVTRMDELDAVKAESHCSASALYLPVESVDLKATPRLHWRWKIDSGFAVPDERTKAGDDYAARVSVMFRFDPQHASLWERARHRVGTTLYGEAIPGHAIDYVWSSHEPAGVEWDNPYGSDSKVVSRGHGPLLRWNEEVVDVAVDYTAFFGNEPPAPLAIAVMTDSDNTCQEATAYYADFRFLSR